MTSPRHHHLVFHNDVVITSCTFIVCHCQMELLLLFANTLSFVGKSCKHVRLLADGCK